MSGIYQGITGRKGVSSHNDREGDIPQGYWRENLIEESIKEKLKVLDLLLGHTSILVKGGEADRSPQNSAEL